MPDHPSRAPRSIRPFALLAAVLVAAAAYWPGLSGQFLFDDLPNIVDNPDLRMERLDLQALRNAMLSGHAGPLGRPVSMLSFALDRYVLGLDPAAFKAVNLAVHLCSGLGLFVLTRLLLGAWRRQNALRVTEDQVYWAGLFVAAAWLVHPFNLSAVLYVVQRMTLLAALFVIWALVLYAHGRSRLIDGGRAGWMWLAGGMAVLTPLAALSKENGALVPLYALLIELLVFRFKGRRADRNWLIALFAATVALPAAAAFAFLVTHPEWLQVRYGIRDFTPLERLLTEARVLWYYVLMSFTPNPGSMGLYHDNWTVSGGLLAPLSTLPSVAGVLALPVAALLLARRYPMAAFGLLFYLAGHSLESTIIPLELVFDHRNYLPLYGLLLLVLQAGLLLDSESAARIRPYLATALVALLAASTAVRADYWGDPLRHALIEVSHNPNSPRANHQAGVAYSTLAFRVDDPDLRAELFTKATEHFRLTTTLDENATPGLFAMIMTASRKGDSVDRETVEELTHRLSTAPMRASSVNNLRALIECRATQRCTVGEEVMNRIITATLQNDTLVGRPRAMAAVASANYLLNQSGNVEDSLRLVYYALSLDPDNTPLRLNLAEVLLSLNQHSLARDQLAAAERRDPWGLYSADIRRLRSKLEDATQTPTSGAGSTASRGDRH